MKLHSAVQTSGPRFTAYDFTGLPSYIEVDAQRYTHPVLVMVDQTVQVFEQLTFETLAHTDLERIRSLQPDVVLIGTGARQRFMAADLLWVLQSQAIGVELMDSSAAARTYNILMLEGRRVCALILF